MASINRKSNNHLSIPIITICWRYGIFNENLNDHLHNHGHWDIFSFPATYKVSLCYFPVVQVACSSHRTWYVPLSNIHPFCMMTFIFLRLSWWIYRRFEPDIANIWYILNLFQHGISIFHTLCCVQIMEKFLVFRIIGFRERNRYWLGKVIPFNDETLFYHFLLRQTNLWRCWKPCNWFKCSYAYSFQIYIIGTTKMAIPCWTVNEASRDEWLWWRHRETPLSLEPVRFPLRFMFFL